MVYIPHCKLDMLCPLLRFGDEIRIIGNTGSNSTREAVHATSQGFAVGMHAALQINPYYGKTSLAGLRTHFEVSMWQQATSCKTQRPHARLRHEPAWGDEQLRTHIKGTADCMVLASAAGPS